MQNLRVLFPTAGPQSLYGNLDSPCAYIFIYIAESNGKLPHLSISSKTAAWIPEFAVEDLPLSKAAAVVPEFAVKDLPLGRIL